MSALIVGYARTPFARFNGRLATVSATELGAHAAKAALERAGIPPGRRFSGSLPGMCCRRGAGQNPARQAAVAAGVPLTVPAITLNAVCLSGMEAVVAAERLIAGGEADIVLAIGQESMSLAPHLLGARAGQKYGAMELVDTLELDGLTDAFERRAMGTSTEDGNTELGLDRDSQDTWAASSHQRAAANAAFHAGEIEPYRITSRRGDTLIADDDGVRTDTTFNTLAGLRPAFSKDGTITAGNSSQITDGAAALVLGKPSCSGITGALAARSN